MRAERVRTVAAQVRVYVRVEAGRRENVRDRESTYVHNVIHKREKVNTFSECLDKTGSSVRRPLICLVVLIHCVPYV